jgi:hypothetical protein
MRVLNEEDSLRARVLYSIFICKQAAANVTSKKPKAAVVV